MLRKAQILWSVFVALTTAAVVGLVWFHLDTYLHKDRAVVAARDAQRKLFELTITAQDAENAARGFLLTGREEFLARHQVARRDVLERLEAAAPAVEAIGLAERLEAGRPVLRQRLDMLDQMIAQRTGGRTEESVAMLDSPAALENAAKLRRLQLDLLGGTDDELQRRLAECRRSVVAMTRWVLAGVGSLVVASAALLWLMWRDIVRRRRVAAELAAARDAALAGTRARDEFLNVLSHELRTPLTPALACVGLLLRRTPPDSPSHEELTMIRRQLELEARLIDDLLNVEQVVRGSLELKRAPVAVHALLNQVIAGHRDELQAEHLELEAHLDAADDRVTGDEARLHLVLWHLLGNAVKFTPGGSIRVRTDNADGKIQVTFADTGVGMTPEQLGDLFTPFKQADSSLTRRFGGLGVGLAISRHVAELHGGTIHAVSLGKGVGSTFTLELPLAAAVASPNAASPATSYS